MKDSTVTYYEFGQFCLHLENRRLLKNGKDISLTQKSFDILLYLIENREKVISKEELLEHFWDEKFVEESNLVQSVYRIRKSLKGDKDEDEFIKTVPKIGYRFVAEIRLDTGKSNNSSLKADGQNGIQQVKTQTQAKNNVDDLEKQSFDYNEPKKDKESNLKTNQEVFKRGLLIPIFVSTFIITLLLGTYFFYFKTQNTDISNIKSLAILPFKQIGGKPNEKLGLGMADTLISKLSNQKKINISPTATIIKFLDEETEDPITIGEKLNVDAILVGTIQRENEDVRVNIQIISVKEKIPVWSEKFDSKYSNIFSLQDEVSQHIVQELSLGLNNQQVSQLEIKHSKNIEAYKAYSNGLFHWAKRTPEGLSKALVYFQTAIDIDPEFARAYAYLADTYSLIGYNKYDLMPGQKAMAKAKEFADKTLELDPNSSEAITTLAIVAMYEKRVDKSRTLLNKAIKLKPNNITAYTRLAWINAREGDLESAVKATKIAYKIDPQSDSVHKNLAAYLLLARKPDEALALSQRIMETSPPSLDVNIFLAEVYEQKKQYKKAIAELDSVHKKRLNDCNNLLALTRLYAKDNKMDKARKMLNESLMIKECQQYNFPKALAYLYLGENDKVLPLIVKDNENPWHLILLKSDYNLDPIRDTPKFQNYLSQAKAKFK